MKKINALLIAGLSFLSPTAMSAEVNVTASPLAALQMQMTSEFPASAEPIETSLLSSGISAEIVSIAARPGDRVKRGDVLVRLDCRDTLFRRDMALQDVKQATIQLKFRERQSERIAKLAETNIASEELKDTRATELQQAQIRLDANRVALDDAELQVARCEVKSPFDAVITDQLASVGTRVSIGTPILQVVSVAVDIRARVPFDYRVDSDQDVDFESGQRSIDVDLLVDSEAVDTGTGTRLLRFKPRTSLAPGTPGRLIMRSQTTVLPADFLVERNSLYGVMTVIDERAVFIERPKALLGQPVVVSDLDPGLLLIQEGRFRVRHGDTVVIRP